MRSSKQINFLRALAGDKASGKTPPQSMNSQQNPKPTPIVHIPQAPAPNLKPIGSQMNPIAAPGLPGMDKLPKFGKMRNSLKGGPFKK